ncbi:right-handed parallel beta-helix repeat-containing protein [bacterium]|nr:right-handed parallel beta-helix repeat-containing protein [bacterium]
MFRCIALTFFIVLSIVSLSVADTTFVAPGPVSGMWTPDDNPYFVSIGDIIVESGASLMIEPGVEVLFTNNYKFMVQGLLIAEGTPSDSIYFTRAYPTEESKWRGFRFNGAEAGCTLSYCVVEYAKGTGAYPDVRGGGVWIENCSPVISHCTIAHNYSHNENYNGSGAGIFVTASLGTIIEQCHITDNLGDNGGGICVGQGVDMIIRYNLIEQNTVYSSGGGIYVSANGQATIHDNVISDNQSNGIFGGGGINLWCATWLYGTFCTVYNNLIIDNNAVSSGGGVYHRYENSILYNNTIAGNSASQGGGIYVLTFPDYPPNIYNSIVWNNSASTGSQIFLDPVASSAANVSYSDVMGGWPGTGNFDEDPLFVTGPDGDYYLSQTTAGQTEQSPCVDTGDPGSSLDDRTTRTDQVPDWIIVDMGFHYIVPDPPEVVLSLDYVSGSPVPATGGNLYFDLYFENLDSEPINFEACLLADWYGGAPAILALRTFTDFQPGWTINRPGMFYPVPGAWPAGEYDMYAFVGPIWQYDWAQDHFHFEKLPNGDGAGGNVYPVLGAPNPFDEIITNSTITPSDHTIVSCYPNPFNPVTTIRYHLPEFRQVNIRVYDIQGRRVAKLVDGCREAGYHEVTFDASDLASGVYLYTLQTGDYQATGKMVLMK